MLEFTRFILDNGLRVIHHFDPTTPLAVVNVLYNVGARDEDPEFTGLAHLFEHLMFSGSAHAESYDEPLQVASGENNAFTSNDITNYYVTLPAENLETAFWLESDRMFLLNLNEKSMGIQKDVVMEEFKQRYLNQPYGDMWLHFRPLVYEKHPYRWPTIGKELSHIEKVELPVLQNFYKRFYNPSNAILVVAGNVEEYRTRSLVDKWFGDIPAGPKNENKYPDEPALTQARTASVESDVPMDCLSIGFHAPARTDRAYYASELLSDILGGNESSRLYQTLVKEKNMFADIACFTTGSLSTGLFTISGRLLPGNSIEDGEAAVWQVIDDLINDGILAEELERVCNKKLTVLKYQELEVLNKAMNLAMFENMGDAAMANDEASLFLSVSKSEIDSLAARMINKSASSTLNYYAKNSVEN